MTAIEKCIVVIEPDGAERVLDHVPNLKEMQAIVGGYIEMVRVLRQDITDRIERTYMVVDEEGLLKHKPKNAKASELYLALVRRQFPESDTPWDEAKIAFRKSLEDRGFTPTTYIDATADIYGGQPPFIAGTVIHFEGYTTAEIDEAWGD